MDKETGKAIEQNGKAVTAETSFTATAAQGSVDLTFVYDSSVLEGKQRLRMKNCIIMKKMLLVTRISMMQARLYRFRRFRQQLQVLKLEIR